MSGLHFENRRFDPDLVEFHELAKAMVRSVGYTAALSVDGQLAQSPRLHVAQLDPCSHCLIPHTKAAHDQGVSAERVSNLPSWRESALYRDPERAAPAYGEALTGLDIVDFSARHEVMSSHFDEKQIAEIAAIVIKMNLWTRLKMAQGATPVAAAS